VVGGAGVARRTRCRRARVGERPGLAELSVTAFADLSGCRPRVTIGSLMTGYAISLSGVRECPIHSAGSVATLAVRILCDRGVLLRPLVAGRTASFGGVSEDPFLPERVA
jgi:hypothetical protein